MNESIIAISTSSPLSRPRARPSSSTIATAANQGTPKRTCRLIAMMCQSTMP